MPGKRELIISPYLDGSIACFGGRGQYQAQVFYVGKQRRAVRSAQLTLGDSIPDQFDPARIFRRVRKVAARTTPIPAENIAAVSLVRHCTKKLHERKLNIERVVAYVVARNMSDILIDQESISFPGKYVSGNEGRAVRADLTGNVLYPVISMPLTEQEAAEYPAMFVLPTFPKLLTGDGPYAAIHGTVGDSVETIIRAKDVGNR